MDINAQMSVTEYYKLIDSETGSLSKELVANIKTGSSLHIGIVFDTSFKADFHSEKVNGILRIAYLEHQHIVIY